MGSRSCSRRPAPKPARPGPPPRDLVDLTRDEIDAVLYLAAVLGGSGAARWLETTVRTLDRAVQGRRLLPETAARIRLRLPGGRRWAGKIVKRLSAHTPTKDIASDFGITMSRAWRVWLAVREGELS